MQVFTGNDLIVFLEKRHTQKYNRRYIYSEVLDYINDNEDFRVCCLYGLRRTGKTIMMAQAVCDKGEFNNSLYIICNDGDSLGNICNAIDKSSDRYIFLDEVTKSYDFINTCSVLADRYTFSGKKIVMAGTDSLGFQISKYDELFDRVKLIHTTYIPYKEYNYLIGKDIDYYINYGGLLISEDEKKYNDDILKEYTDGAIVHNIMHSLDNWNRGNNHVLNKLKKIYDEADFVSIIHKVIDRENRDFLISTVNNNFSAEEFGSFLDLLVKHPISDIDKEALDKKEFIDRFRAMLGVREPLSVLYDEYAVNLIKGYLEDLDMLYYVKNTDEYIIMQPGIRHYHTMVLIDALYDEFSEAPIASKLAMKEKLESSVCGHILEDMVYIDTLKCFEGQKNIIVSKYRDLKYSREFDITIIDTKTNKAIAIEVKHSSEIVENQTRHLRDNEFCEGFEKANGVEIISKIVIYNGKETEIDGIKYINASDYLCDIEGQLNKSMNNLIQRLNQSKEKGIEI
ncbi:MAG: ATP-binding protein [Eubacterium sp.]|nr:ATP-binding protein [Eubacterium sp.]